MKITLTYHGPIAGWEWSLILAGKLVNGTGYKSRQTVRRGAMNWTDWACDELYCNPIEWEVVE